MSRHVLEVPCILFMGQRENFIGFCNLRKKEKIHSQMKGFIEGM
jgi:hypothetical protein